MNIEDDGDGGVFCWSYLVINTRQLNVTGELCNYSPSFEYLTTN